MFSLLSLPTDQQSQPLTVAAIMMTVVMHRCQRYSFILIHTQS
jgi:hypothetical protein